MGARLGLVGVLLTFAAGSTDLACFLRLDHVFASVMTGNLVLLGLAAGTGNGAAAWHTGVALLGYVAGTLAGVTVTQALARSTSRQGAFLAGLGVELVPLAGFWVLWRAGSGDPSGAAGTATLSLAAVAMGMQSATVLFLDEPRLATTYLTSTLTRFLASVVAAALRLGGWTGRDANAVLRLAALVGGAALTALLVGAAPVWAPALAVVPVLTAAAVTVRGPLTGRA